MHDLNHLNLPNISDSYVRITNVTTHIQIGSQHAARGEACEDVIFRKETPELAFYGLADGQSGRDFCREGAVNVLRVLDRYLRDREIPELMLYRHRDELQYEIIRCVRDEIDRLAVQSAVPEEEFSSTIVAFAVHPQSGTYITLHLGDGGVIGRKRDHSLSLVSAPENGITSRYTWFTTSEDALQHLRISFGYMRYYDRILIYTDGACSLCRGRNIPREAARLLKKNENAGEVIRYLSESEPMDDASCILIDFE